MTSTASKNKIYGCIKCEVSEFASDEYLVSVTTADGKRHIVVNKGLVHPNRNGWDLEVIVLPNPSFFSKTTQYKRVLLPAKPMGGTSPYALVDPANLCVWP